MSNASEKVLSMLVAKKIDVKQTRRILDQISDGSNKIEAVVTAKDSVIELLVREKISFDEASQLLDQLNDRPEEARSLSGSKQKIIGLLAEEKVNVDEALRLLKRANESVRMKETAQEPSSEPQPVAVARTSSNKRPKFLRVLIHDGDSEKVDVRVPLKLVKMGMVYADFVPESARDIIASQGIDLSNLSGLNDEDFYEAFGALRVDIVDEDSTVQVFCE